ncbi:MAG: DUF2029 domain-containing protein [Actinobacteria bacterium]|uniref:Unannotated protein n=1 Tax=freshwater metagenome TaxID=449393 RepID=A0A6J6FN07_9ZZZZ|nr:DUF2029 domain-containing protein [Actinomycetota bacterium]
MRASNPETASPVVSTRALWWIGAIFFVVVHLVLITENLRAPNQPLGDITYTYPLWIAEAMTSGLWPGLTTDGVYPYLALIPMTIGAYGLNLWFGLCIAVDGIAWWVLARRSIAAAFAWLLFLAVLGPIALGRIDVVTVALAIAAIALVERSPRVAGVVIAIATWIKVWPIVLGLSALLTNRGSTVARWAFVSAVLIGGVGVALGDPAHVLSFLGSQQGRGIQIEAVAATPWLWDAWAGGVSRVIFTPEIFTFEVVGPGTAEVSTLITAIAAIALGIVALAVLRLTVRVKDRPAGFPFAATITLLVSMLVVVNKVGSPQFVSWYGVAVAVLVIWFHPRWSPTLLFGIGIIAVLTHVLYPYAYFDFVDLQYSPLMLITLRNAVEVAVLVVAAIATIRALRVEKLSK